MVIEPTDRDLQDLNALLNQHPDAWEANREQLVKIWEGAVHAALRESLSMTLHRRVREMMTPPPSLKRRCCYL